MRQLVKPGGHIDAATRDEIAELLTRFARSSHHAFGSDSIERTLENWPVIGHERKVAVNRSRGDSNLVLGAAVYFDLVDNEAGRGGLSVINIGANPCFVYLTDAQTAQGQNGKVAAGYMFPGGAWDGKIGNETWVGKVSLQSPLGTTIVWAAI